MLNLIFFFIYLIITIKHACHAPLKIENQNFEVLNKVDLNPSS